MRAGALLCAPAKQLCRSPPSPSDVHFSLVKLVNELTPDDLHRVPVWRYEGEIDEVAVVHATERRTLDASERGVFIAHTQFVLADGTQHVGFCSPCDASGLDYLQPVIVTPDGQVYFWFDEPPSYDSLQRQLRRLGARSEIFPIHFRCTVPVDGSFITGVIEADDLTGAA